MTPAELLQACRVPQNVRSGTYGPWIIGREAISDPYMQRRTGWSTITLLGRPTLGTLHRHYGEVVMEDSRRELARHLPILLSARGRVLVTGLGLGCVVRGLLAKREVEHVDVVELCPHILRAVGTSFRGCERLTLHQADALTWDPGGASWDYAWHDIWCEENDGLNLLHTRLIARFHDVVERQGAWAFPRPAKRVIREHGYELVG